MRKARSPFDIAIIVILLGIGIPSVVGMFGVLRARQLQSKANPRWAHFAKLSGQTNGDESTEKKSARLPVQTASVCVESRTEIDSTVARFGEDPDLTGSVSGHRSIEMPVHSESTSDRHRNNHHEAEKLALIVQQPIIFRPVEESSDCTTLAADSLQSARRLESRLMEVRQRLEKLVEKQELFRADDIQRDSQLLEALNRLTESMAAKPRIDGARYDEITFNRAPIEETHVEKLNIDQRPDEAPHSRTAENPIPEVQAQPTKPDPASEDPTPASPTGHSKSTVSVDETTSYEVSNSYEDSKSTASPENEQPSRPSQQFPELKSSITNLPMVSQPVEETIRILRIPGRNSESIFTIEARDAEIRQFLVKLSEAAGVNILMSPEVCGTISLNLHQVAFETALKAIIKSRNYVVERENGIIIVSTVDESVRLKSQDRKLLVRMYQPSYLSSAQFGRLIEPLLSTDGRISFSSTAEHPVEGDEIDIRETVIVQDVAEKLSQVDQILVDMDVPPLQVEIEAKILSVRLIGKLQQGIDMRLLPCQHDAACADCEWKQANLSGSVPEFIKSLEGLGNTNVVTTQRIRVLNKHRAEILIGDKVGLQSRPGGKIRFVESGTQLMVRPTISADGFIRVEIHPERNSTVTDRRSKVTQQNTASLTTQVLVRDGATIAIGGMISDQIIQTGNRRSIIGTAFRPQNEQIQRTELMILLTPHIVTDCTVDGVSTQTEHTIKAVSSVRETPVNSYRQEFARSHYVRAASDIKHGNPVKARQQIDASLKLNQRDADAIRLRDEINQRLTKSTSSR